MRRHQPCLHAALALWRGQALADVADTPFARSAATRLSDQHLLAVERRIDSDLKLGRAQDMLPELEALVASHQYHEPFHRQLMLALYRSGQQSEALGAFRRARDLLAGELGIEPGPELRRMEQAILRQDPELEQPPALPPQRPRRLEPAPARTPPRPGSASRAKRCAAAGRSSPPGWRSQLRSRRACRWRCGRRRRTRASRRTASGCCRHREPRSPPRWQCRLRWPAWPWAGARCGPRVRMATPSTASIPPRRPSPRPLE